MNIGDKIKLVDVRRALTHNGYPVSFDPGLDVTGEVVSIQNFIIPRAGVNFVHEHRTYSVYGDQSEF